MKIDPNDFRVPEGESVNLSKCPTIVKPVYDSKKRYQEILEEHVAQLSDLQQLLYASDRYAILLIFQAMYAAGKDGAIKHVMSGVNPQAKYEDCISATSSLNAPWYIVPANDKENARLVVSRILLDTLGYLKMRYPKSSDERRDELLSIRKKLEK